MTKIIKLITYDLRFPTSDNLDGSDAMNPDPDYSAAYVILESENKLLKGHSFAFTLGRGNDLCCEAIRALQHIVLGLDIEWIRDNLSSFSRMMTSDSQLRWVGPEKGIIHMASGAIINAVWEVDEAIKWMKSLSEFNPYFIEEPTSPDDIIGHKKIREAIYPIKVATGEAVQNRIIFKQLISEKAIDIVQVDACRMGGLNEVLAVQLMAAKNNLPVWPHAGGVGLCEYSQHLAMIDYICVSGRKDKQVIEYVDHLHEHFINPCIIKNAAYMLPEESGFSVEMKPETLKNNLFIS